MPGSQKDTCLGLLSLSHFLVEGLKGGVALWTVAADSPTLCELALLHKGAIVESGGPGRGDWVWAGWRRVWGQELQRLGPKQGCVLAFEPTWVLSQLGIVSERNPLARKHLSVLVIMHNEVKDESEFPIRTFVCLIDFSATTWIPQLSFLNSRIKLLVQLRIWNILPFVLQWLQVNDSKCGVV